MMKIINHRWFIPALIVMAMLSWLIWYVWYWESREPLLEVHFFDIARGSAVFVRTPQGKTALIGAGEGGDIVSRLTDVLPLYERQIDTVIVHSVTDTPVQPSGIHDVSSRYRIGSLIDHVTDPIILDEWEGRQVILQPIILGTSTVSILRLKYGSSSVVLIDTLTRPLQSEFARRFSGRGMASDSLRSDIIHVRSTASTKVSHNLFTLVDPKYVVTAKFPARIKPKVSVAKTVPVVTSKKKKTPAQKKEEKFDLYAHSKVKIYALNGKGVVTFTSDGSSFKTKTTE